MSTGYEVNQSPLLYEICRTKEGIEIYNKAVEEASNSNCKEVKFSISGRTYEIKEIK